MVIFLIIPQHLFSPGLTFCKMFEKLLSSLSSKNYSFVRPGSSPSGSLWSSSASSSRHHPASPISGVRMVDGRHWVSHIINSYLYIYIYTVYIYTHIYIYIYTLYIYIYTHKYIYTLYIYIYIMWVKQQNKPPVWEWFILFMVMTGGWFLLLVSPHFLGGQGWRCYVNCYWKWPLK